ncbi:hypothetical protein GUJ93_ZPchr0012g20475 [Zizania palustris]|uniref:Pentatricopeptide repeat-containing protein n=1 Tax=Zizania palustris TaxID=103762 RepID=A0A8J5WSV8_ZIZPA|nr:hypothetical protein GUJ93_ZPchr0012g20475 [Zizania palustris]KAG8094413.1 hypothetical protein GUJ93_ZPchr0012g20475 [Zizania palustris]
MMHDHLAALLLRGGGGQLRAVHGAAVKLGCLASTYLCNNLLLSYRSRGLLSDARSLFDEMPRRNVVSWSVLISASSRLSALAEALSLFAEMLRRGIRESCDRPNSFAVCALVAGCARVKDAVTGEQMHDFAVKLGVDEDESVAGALVDMYAKCGRVGSSWRVLALTSQRNVMSWTSMIACLINHGGSGYRDTAIVLFKKMLILKVCPTNATFSCIMKVFDVPELLPGGKQVHGCLVKMGTEMDPALGTALMAMYGRCGGMDEIAKLACRISHDAFSKTALLVAYARNRCNMEAVGVFQDMLVENMPIDHSTITSLLQVCSSLGQLRPIKEVHCYALKNLFKLDTLLLNAIITVYGRCGDIVSAETAFDIYEIKDTISWTALLTCYVQNGLSQEALFFFREMVQKGLGSSVYCVTSALRACSSIANFSCGWQIHSRVVKLGIDDDNSVENALVTMYAKCGAVRSALKIFNSISNKGIISWNALITSFSQHGNELAAIQLFDMMQEEAVCPDDYTFVGLLSSCSRMGLVAEGCEYFEQMKVMYDLEPKMEHYTCMVDLFARAGRFYDAMRFIDAMPCQPDQLVWEALLASCRVHANVELGRLAAKKILEIRPEDPSPYIILSSIYASIDMWDEKAQNRTVFNFRQVRKDMGSNQRDALEFSDGIFDALQVGAT